MAIVAIVSPRPRNRANATAPSVFVAAAISLQADLGDPLGLPLLDAGEPSACDQKCGQVVDIVTLPLGPFLDDPSLRFAHQLASLAFRLDVDRTLRPAWPRRPPSAAPSPTASFPCSPPLIHRCTNRSATLPLLHAVPSHPPQQPPDLAAGRPGPTRHHGILITSHVALRDAMLGLALDHPQAAADLWTHLARQLRGQPRAEALTVAGVCYCLLGDAVRAGIATDAALDEAERRHVAAPRLAHLLLSALHAGIPPKQISSIIAESTPKPRSEP